MRIVQTLLIRDEIDIVEAFLEYHLSAGVDLVIATDHESSDGTSEILDAFSAKGRVVRIPKRGPFEEQAWRTHMARLAATEHGADWVINSDADEFWMPREGSLKDVFAAIPQRIGVVWGLTRHFVPRPGHDHFAERMTARVSAATPLNDPTSPYRPHAKVAHRPDPRVAIRYGAHLVYSTLAPLVDWYVADVFHFPFRSLDQYLRKSLRRVSEDWLGQYRRAAMAHEAGEAERAFRSLVVDDPTLARGLESGALVEDMRLRDALRRVRDGGRISISGDGASELRRSHLEDAAGLLEADTVRLWRRVDDLARRVTTEELHGRRRRS